MNRTVSLALVLATCVAAGWAPASARATALAGQESAATLVDLNAPGDLRARFNSDRGTTRLVVLLSPT